MDKIIYFLKKKKNHNVLTTVTQLQGISAIHTAELRRTITLQGWKQAFFFFSNFKRNIRRVFFFFFFKFQTEYQPLSDMTLVHSFVIHITAGFFYTTKTNSCASDQKTRNQNTRETKQTWYQQKIKWCPSYPLHTSQRFPNDHEGLIQRLGANPHNRHNTPKKPADRSYNNRNNGGKLLWGGNVPFC